MTLAGRPVLPLAGTALLVLGALFAGARPPRFVWLNSGLSIEHSWPEAAAAGLAAAGAFVAWHALGSRLRWAALLAGAAAAGFALQLALYRVAAEEGGLSERGLLGSRTLAWTEISRVESGSRFVVVWGRDDSQLRIDTRAFPPEERARLDRTIARRVREAAGR